MGEGNRVGPMGNRVCHVWALVNICALNREYDPIPRAPEWRSDLRPYIALHEMSLQSLV